MTIFASPDRSLSNGNWISARHITNRKISPSIVASLFVAMNCLGTFFLISSLMVSLPMYLYPGFFFASVFVEPLGAGSSFIIGFGCFNFGIGFFVVEIALEVFFFGGVSSFTVGLVTSSSGIFLCSILGLNKLFY